LFINSWHCSSARGHRKASGALDELHAALRWLRHAQCDIASLLFEQAPAPAPAWVRRTWALPLGLLTSVAAVLFSLILVYPYRKHSGNIARSTS
jgi:ferric-dicitrate binding protein FerR (iron transport regulator)